MKKISGCSFNPKALACYGPLDIIAFNITNNCNFKKTHGNRARLDNKKYLNNHR